MRTRNLVLAAVVVLGAMGVGAAWFVGRDTPDAVDIDRAVAGVTDAAPSEQDEEAAAVAEPFDPSGTWMVATDAVVFDAETGGGTWVGYRIDEELSGIGAYTAVGRSPTTEGSIVIVGTEVVSAEVRADLTGLVSDNANRDARVRPLFTERPVTFTLDEPVDFGSVPADGQRIAVAARGVLSIGEVSRDVEVELSADVAGELLVVTGSTVVALADFGVVVPSAPVVLSVSDEATVELQLYLARG
jgi:hypothetical protein